MSIGKLEEKAPHVTSVIYDYKLQFQVIDYMTPRYLHLQVIRGVYENDEIGQDIRPLNVGTGVSYVAEIIICFLLKIRRFICIHPGRQNSHMTACLIRLIRISMFC